MTWYGQFLPVMKIQICISSEPRKLENVIEAAIDGGINHSIHCSNNSTTIDNDYNGQSGYGITGGVYYPNYINTPKVLPEVPVDVRLNETFIDYENSDQCPRLEVCI